MNDEKGRAEGGTGRAGTVLPRKGTSVGCVGCVGCVSAEISAWELDEPLGLFLTETGDRGFPIWKDGQPPEAVGPLWDSAYRLRSFSWESG
jgi:hypothetical protein